MLHYDIRACLWSFIKSLNCSCLLLEIIFRNVWTQLLFFFTKVEFITICWIVFLFLSMLWGVWEPIFIFEVTLPVVTESLCCHWQPHLSFSNPVVQVSAVESGTLQTLLTLLATTNSSQVKKKVHEPIHRNYKVYFFPSLTCHLSGSFCFSILATSFPVCTAPFPVTWRAPGPLRVIQGRWSWNSAYTHCHHVVWHDKWEGTKNIHQYLNVMFVYVANPFFGLSHYGLTLDDVCILANCLDVTASGLNWLNLSVVVFEMPSKNIHSHWPLY